jgi:DNA-binding GntR family transcriptional regulator
MASATDHEGATGLPAAEGPADIEGPAEAAAEGAPQSAVLPLAQKVAGSIRDMIVQDLLPPGARIRERTLAQQLEVSRTPLREALKVLATEGLVELLPNRGALVADPSPVEIRDMLRVLGALEAVAGEVACSAASAEEIAEIKALHYEMLAAFARQDRLEYFKINQKIHLAIVAASRNRTLIEIHRLLNARLYRTRYRSNLKNRDWPSAVGEHEAILSALEARDGARLAVLLKDHLGNTWSKVSEILSTEDPGEQSIPGAT